jgi:hypothetical protein
MLARRGLRPSLARPYLPFPSDISAETAEALAERLGHYAFRLFVRGVIHRGDGFTPGEATSYVSAAQARTFTETLVALGVVAASGRDRYRLVRRAAVSVGRWSGTSDASSIGGSASTSRPASSSTHVAPAAISIWWRLLRGS